MRRYAILLFSLLISYTNSTAQDLPVSLVFLDTFHISGSSIRAIEVLEDSSLWFAGSGGKFGRISHGSLSVDTLAYQGSIPNFRAVAVTSKDVFLLSVEDPALLYRIQGGTMDSEPELVYRESHPKVFYDAMTFFDDKNGIAMGDPTENCLSVLLTEDGGLHWEKLPCTELPEVHEGEAAFAASNSNVAVSGKRAWMVTGGKSARIFCSEDLGKSWTAYHTPVRQGGTMTGIFTVDFYNENRGIIMGGNWEVKSDRQASAALTTDGGKSWKLVTEDQAPGYISCVRYVPGSGGEELVGVSTQGIFYSATGGSQWQKLSDRGFYSIRFADRETAWVSTEQMILKIKLKRK